MSKRKLNLQQQKRIQQAQQERYLDADTQAARVICRYGKQAIIATETNGYLDCHLRPNLPPIVAGDNVRWQMAPSAKTGVIVGLSPRSSVIERIDKEGSAKPLAANVSQFVVVLAPEPAILWPLLDDYLIAAAAQKLKVCLVLNKTDLPSSEEKKQLETIYRPLGYPIYTLSRSAPETYQTLEAALQGEVSIFLGQSGVGKSSLTHVFLPHADPSIKTSPLSQGHGQHTTTFARYYPLPHGGALIDSPGVRTFQPVIASTEALLAGYPELKPFLGKCQFRNCSHIDAKGCVIRYALEQGKISEARYVRLMKKIMEKR